MKTRVITNWKTTVLAVLILISCGLAIWFKVANWTEVIGFMTLSGLLAWVKDSIFKVNPDADK